MESTRRDDRYTHYQICRARGLNEKAESYAKALRATYKNADKELEKIDRKTPRTPEPGI